MELATLFIDAGYFKPLPDANPTVGSSFGSRQDIEVRASNHLTCIVETEQMPKLPELLDP